MAALVAVMTFVSIATFDWHGLRTLHVMPWDETTVMRTTMVGTLLTHDLAIGVGAGVLTARVLFARRVAHLVEVTSDLDADGTTRVPAVRGALFSASSNELYTQFDDAGDPPQVRIDLSQAQVWDASTVAGPDAITDEYALRSKSVELAELDRHSGQLAGAR